ncbi:MAG: AraC family transcriptional regulator [Chitinophagaceae bacterium]
MTLPKKIAYRQQEIMHEFLTVLDRHLEDILSGRAEDMYHIKDVAKEMHIHPTHLSNTVKEVTGKAPCFFFEEKLMNISKKMLADPSVSVASIARRLTFDTSNFTKFFKRFEGVTPSVYRQMILESTVAV